METVRSIAKLKNRVLGDKRVYIEKKEYVRYLHVPAHKNYTPLRRDSSRNKLYTLTAATK